MPSLKPLLIVLIFCFNISCKKDDNPVVNDPVVIKVTDQYGVIHTSGNQIVDKNNNPIALHGMSLFWSQWGGTFYNEYVIKWLKDDWKCTVIRAACGVESGGYLSNPQIEYSKITSVIDACIKEGIYVIVDWHDHHAESHLQQSKEFFKSISIKYGGYSNLIYELYNEPLQVSWSNVIKPYAEEIIKIIRQNDPDNLIIMGSPDWSQAVDSAAGNPVKDVNLAYSFHFYTGTHKKDLRDRAVTAINKGIALFVTEYGISEANGNGTINFEETLLWLNFVRDYKLSTCNWSIIDKEETSAALKPGANTKGNWNEKELTISGTYIRNYIRSQNNK